MTAVIKCLRNSLITYFNPLFFFHQEKCCIQLQTFVPKEKELLHSLNFSYLCRSALWSYMYM